MEHEIVHVAIEPPAKIEPDLVKNIAAILNKQLYDTRLLLTGELPKIIAHYQSMEAAESTARSLHDMGIVAIAVSDSELHRTMKSFSVHSMEFGSGEVVFHDQGGLEKRTGTGDVFLIIKGINQNCMEQEEPSTKRKLSLPLTALMGGIPIWRTVKEQSRQSSVETEWFANLYSTKSSEPIVQILQHHVDYSFLGTDLAPSSFTNFNSVISKLLEVCTDAILDERLTRPLMTGKSLTPFQDDLQSKSTLIYLCHLASAGADPTR